MCVMILGPIVSVVLPHFHAKSQKLIFSNVNAP